MGTTRIEESERQARAWLVHLTSGTATREDGEAFRRWCLSSEQHAEAFARARRMWEDLGPAIAAHTRPERGDHAPQRHRVRMGRRAFVTTAIGASVAAVLLARIDLDRVFRSGGVGRLRTAVGEQRRVDVVPGVTVEMNTATDIALRGTGKAVTGMRLRSGEAVVRIDASRKAGFVVDIGDATVASTPGSAVAVRCIDSESVVTCLDGQALLSLGSTESLVKPAQQVSFDARGIAAAVAVNPDTALAWRNRVLIYDNQPLAQVVADINRYRPGRIVITDRALGDRRVHARFTLDQMADVATLIQDAYGAHATHLPGGWVLLS
ncbi:FecR family protein [Luteibacter sp. NPDC031894]|uniref:FecR family protein n=1 Tax=Luteibacter sp. NPDC031894 TaxID=3390572 RepID=UPI003D04DC57